MMDNTMMNNDDDRIVYNVYMIDILEKPGDGILMYCCSFINEDTVKQYVATMNHYYANNHFYKAEKLSNCTNIPINFCKDEYLFFNRTKSLYDVCVINISHDEDLIINHINGMNVYKKMVQAIEDTALIFSVESGTTEEDISKEGLALLNGLANYFPKIEYLITEYANVMKLKILSNVDLAPQSKETEHEPIRAINF